MTRESSLYVTLAAGWLLTLAFMTYAGQPSSLTWFAEISGFAAWASAPFATVAVVGRSLRNSSASISTLLLAAILLVLLTGVVLYISIVAQPDAQGGLIFLFLPLYQLLSLLIPLLVALVLHRRAAD